MGIFTDKGGSLKTLPIVAVLIALLVILVYGALSVYSVPAGSQAVVFDQCQKGGVEPTTMPPGGWYTKNPFCQTVTLFNVRVQSHDSSLAASSPVGNAGNSIGVQGVASVYADVNVQYSLDASQVNAVYLKYQDESHLDALIEPVIQQDGKECVVQYELLQVTPHRADIGACIAQKLTSDLTKYYLIVNQVSFADVHFDPTVQQNLEATATAQQQVLQAQQALERTNLTAQAYLLQANAVATGIRLQADAINNATAAGPNGSNGFVEYTKWSRWNGQLPLVEGGGALVGTQNIPPGPALPSGNSGNVLLNIPVPPPADLTNPAATTPQPPPPPNGPSHPTSGFAVAAALVVLAVVAVAARRRR